MNSLVEIQIPLAVNVRMDAKLFYIELEDGREIGVPYNWYERLAKATDAERRNWRFIGEGSGIHWEDIDEDISIAGILKGNQGLNLLSSSTF